MDLWYNINKTSSNTHQTIRDIVSFWCSFIYTKFYEQLLWFLALLDFRLITLSTLILHFLFTCLQRTTCLISVYLYGVRNWAIIYAWIMLNAHVYMLYHYICNSNDRNHQPCCLWTISAIKHNYTLERGFNSDVKLWGHPATVRRPVPTDYKLWLSSSDFYSSF